MKRYLGALSALALFVGVGVASAEEAMGTLQEINQETRTIVMDDGTTYTVAEGVSLEGFEPGKQVTVSFEEQGGQKVANEIKPAQ